MTVTAQFHGFEAEGGCSRVFNGMGCVTVGTHRDIIIGFLNYRLSMDTSSIHLGDILVALGTDL
jgi:hypothetical protein